MMNNKFRGYFSLLTLGVVLGACTSAPVAKQSAQSDEQGRLARQAEFRTAVDRYIAQNLTTLPRLLGIEMKTAIGRLGADAQIAARDAVLAEAKAVSGRSLTNLDDLARLSDDEALKVSKSILENPVKFKLPYMSFSQENAWVQRVSQLSNPGTATDAAAAVRGTQPSPLELDEVQKALVDGVIFEKGLLADTDQARNLSVRLLAINAERRAINGNLFLEPVSCNRMNGQLQLEAVENLALLGEMENSALRSAKGQNECVLSRSVGQALVKWYSTALGGAEATSEALAMKASQRAIDLCNKCHVACPIVPVAQQIQESKGVLPSCQ